MRRLLSLTSTEGVNVLLAANESLLHTLHETTHLPWWATLVASTVLLRSTLTLPIAIRQQRMLGRWVTLRPVVQSWGETLKQTMAKSSRSQGASYESYNTQLQKEYRQRVKQLYEDHQCSPVKVFLLPWVQIPLFVCMSLTIRGMAAWPLPWLSNPNLPVEGFTSGGWDGFMDLTAVYGMGVLPIAIGLTNLANVELNALFAKNPTTRQQVLRNIYRMISMAMIPISAGVPMALNVYWLSSSSFSVAQNLALKNPWVRARLGLIKL
ncbi:hypothetical protein BZG36_03514 [Bifiguratus adelaidae]|uniref:Membrane insertase YidC/Oxa/ALB C-terminal domain-containing protein n=1 Tax=Bifiguratus adelaidae TaxID=1938954 RepID=A0A261XY25_9FUNG|nr:hypothetical protein BZG36_03514 [Bifiguratus adelaidae]